jgi:hypothetical protein
MYITCVHIHFISLACVDANPCIMSQKITYATKLSPLIIKMPENSTQTTDQPPTSLKTCIPKLL